MRQTKLTLHQQFLVKFYGVHILESYVLDSLLKDIMDNPNMMVTTPNQEVQKDISFLVEQKMITSTGGKLQITPAGIIKISKGGFVADVKKDKHILLGFWFSFIAFALSIFNFIWGFVGQNN